MAQWVKPPAVMPASHLSADLSSSALFPVQLPANMPWKAAEDAPTASTLTIHVGNLDGIPGS